MIELIQLLGTAVCFAGSTGGVLPLCKWSITSSGYGTFQVKAVPGCAFSLSLWHTEVLKLLIICNTDKIFYSCCHVKELEQMSCVPWS